MSTVNRLEAISEAIQYEIDDLNSFLDSASDTIYKSRRDSAQRELSNIISNLNSMNDSLYVAFEELNISVSGSEKIARDYDVLHDTLKEKLSHEEKTYMRIKYGIDF